MKCQLIKTYCNRLFQYVKYVGTHDIAKCKKSSVVAVINSNLIHLHPTTNQILGHRNNYTNIVKNNEKIITNS